jgi:hypothetical protein
VLPIREWESNIEVNIKSSSVTMYVAAPSVAVAWGTVLQA